MILRPAILTVPATLAGADFFSHASPGSSDEWYIAMAHKKHRFESELHLGLLVIVFVLLALNFVSNYVVFRARIRMQENGLAELSTASIGIGRAVQQSPASGLTAQQTGEFMRSYQLSDLLLVPYLSSHNPEEIRTWFRSTVNGLPPDKIGELADQLLKSEPNKLVRGKGSDYLFVRPVSVNTRTRLLILSREFPELAYLEDAGRLLLLIGEIGLAVVALVYLLVSRFILAPFRRMRQQAIAAGRSIDSSKDEVEQVVVEYEQIIADLKDTETELRRVNTSIRERADSLEEFNRYLMAAVDSGVVTLDMEGRVLTVSVAANRILGIETAARIGRQYGLLFGNAKSIEEAIASALRTLSHVGYMEHEYRLGNGDTRIIGSAISFIRNRTQEPIGVLILLDDLTELATLRHQVEQKNRLEALGEMAGGLAHQLRNSLGAIVGFGALVRKRVGKNELDQSLEAAESLLREAHEAEQLVARFLGFARPLDFHPEPVSLSGLLDEILDSFRQRQDCAHIQFESSYSGNTETLADSVLLKQAIANLVENSVYAYEGNCGHVSVKVETDGDRLSILVLDRGCGIRPEQIDKIFTPFYSSRPSGTGLGLPLARRIIDLHGGTISVDSRAGKGTAFRLTLPIHSPKAIVPAASAIC